HGPAVDLVLTDVQLPDASGVELARRIRELRPGLPILFMSGNHDLSGAAGAIRTEDLVEKPFDLGTLAERIRARVAGPNA
ncbi:MAG: response regulator, partial [Gemmatimonadota bacterium]|nr:response regulator [Gemmatimonadota bacterium]